MHIENTALIVKDYDDAIGFFVDALGFELAEDSAATTDDGRSKRWVVVRPPDAQTGLLLAEADGEQQRRAAGQQYAGRVGLFLRVDDFENARRAMHERGVVFTSEPRQEEYGEVAVFLDSEGNRWDLLGPRRKKSHGTDTTIRIATAGDLDRIKEIAVATHMFTAEEVGFLDDMVNGALDGSLEGHRWLVAEVDDDTVVGAAQYAPEPFADRMWNLYFIAVDPNHQGTGIGSAMMDSVESELTGRGVEDARTLVVETSSTDRYARTREFYAGIGYAEEARIREFYGPDDHKVVFWKSMV